MTNEEQEIGGPELPEEEMVDSLPNALRAVADSMEKELTPEGSGTLLVPPEMLLVLAVIGDQVLTFGSGPGYSRQRHAMALRTGLSDVVDGRGHPSAN